MARDYIVREDYDKVYKDKNNFIWKYYSNRKMKKLFFEDYKKKIKVIGEVVVKEEYEQDSIIYEKNELGIGNIGVNKKINRKVSGYIECGESEYIAIVKSNWVMFFIILMSIIALLLI